MDPTACYLILLESIAEHDYAKAREYALILKNEKGVRYLYGCLGKMLDHKSDLVG